MELPGSFFMEAHPLATLGLTFFVGFLDGLNPCAIATLLLFIGALLAALSGSLAAGGRQEGLRYVWRVAGAYIAGIFLLYFALGAGFLEFASLRIFGNTHLVTRLGALGAVILGLIMLQEALFPATPLRLAMPRSLHGLARRWRQPGTTLGAFAGGTLIGLCTIPCGGAVYLAAASAIAMAGSRSFSYLLLTTYNLAFVAPLLLLVAVAGSRPALVRLERWHVRSRGRIKGLLAGMVILLGLAVLYLV